MRRVQKMRRTVVAIIAVLGFGGILFTQPNLWQPVVDQPQAAPTESATGVAADTLATLAVKGRAPKTNYSREQFGNGWETKGGCDTRNIILNRDLKGPAVNEKCQVTAGTFDDPYTGKTIEFKRGADSSSDVQIDHVVALSDAWQKGAQQLSSAQREAMANDPLELLASDGAANQQKSDGDAATWLPPNNAFRCQYVARQVAVKKKYRLWVTSAEKDAIGRILATCPGQPLPSEKVAIH